MNVNGHAKTASGGIIGLIALATAVFGGTEATGKTNFLGGLTKDQVLEICASADDFTAVKQLTMDNTLARLYTQLDEAKISLRKAEDRGDNSEASYWRTRIREIEAQIRKLGG